jgi:hypothetical protein
MFESSLEAKLKADATLVGYLSSRNSSPSIFAEFAPEGVELPYIVFRISRSGGDDSMVQPFNVYIDIFDYSVSSKKVRSAAERVEFILDKTTLNHERYDTIRMFFYNGEQIQDDEDKRKIHYNLLFEARAGRKKWMDNKVTTEGE